MTSTINLDAAARRGREAMRAAKVFGPHPRDAFVSGEVMRAITPAGAGHGLANVLTMASVKAAAQWQLIRSGVDPRGQIKVRIQDGTWPQKLIEAGLLRPDGSVLAFVGPVDGCPIVRFCGSAQPKTVGRFRLDPTTGRLGVETTALSLDDPALLMG